MSLTTTMTTSYKSVLECIQDKYCDDENDNYGFIVFVSNSPESKKGLLPPVITLCDYGINSVGSVASGLNLARLCHVSELDLTDNNLSNWKEILVLLKKFSGLRFLNLSNNKLDDSLKDSPDILEEMAHESFNHLQKLVLNNNKIGWSSADLLISSMPSLDELYLSNNDLKNPDNDVKFIHSRINSLYLTRNLELTNFDSLITCLSLPSLTFLSLSGSGIVNLPDPSVWNLTKLTHLSLSETKISEWSEVVKIRHFESVKELRIMHCPFADGYAAKQRRMLLVAQLPNIQILNGGDKIPATERESAERGYIRHHNDDEIKPERWHELVGVYGHLDPLVNIDLAPATTVSVTIKYEDQEKKETIDLYQKVSQFRLYLLKLFKIPKGQPVRLFYVDQYSGPDEMRWAQKDLYTYNVAEGDTFIVQPKIEITKSPISVTGSAIFTPNKNSQNPKNVSRNLFGNDNEEAEDKRSDKQTSCGE